MSDTLSLRDFDNKLLNGLQFYAMTYNLFEQIRNEQKGISNLREKKLLEEELLPICKYVQAKYRIGRYISVKWLNGNQQFDAKIEQIGVYIDRGYFPSTAHLEVTCVMHRNEYLRRKLLDTKGCTFGLDGIRRLKSKEIESKPVVFKNQEFIHSYAKLVLKQIEKKAAINYPPETTLIVQCTLNIPYMPNEWELLTAEIGKLQFKHQFREIFMYDVVSEYSHSL
jgi:hypothetical protein